MPSPPAGTLAVSEAAPQLGTGLSCDVNVLTLTNVGGRVVVTPSEKEGGLTWLEDLDNGCSVEDRLVDDICGAPDDTDVDILGAREEDNKVDELLSAVGMTDDVDKIVLAVTSDREAVVRRLDDPKVEKKELDEEALADEEMLPADVLSDVRELGTVEPGVVPSSDELDIVIKVVEAVETVEAVDVVEVVEAVEAVEVVEAVGITTTLSELRLTPTELLRVVEEVTTAMFEEEVGTPMLLLTETKLLGAVESVLETPVLLATLEVLRDSVEDVDPAIEDDDVVTTLPA